MHLFCNIDTACQPFETPADIIRRQAGNDYDGEVERRARESTAKRSTPARSRKATVRLRARLWAGIPALF